jgi:hypothetical protein
MAHIIRERERREGLNRALSFHWRNDTGAGFSFPCDASGNTGDLNPDAARNLAACLSGAFDVVADGVVAWPWAYTEPAALRCDCGREVTLDGFTCSCDCGRDYNSAGQRLAPRSQWGEETGESLGDILAIR